MASKFFTPDNGYGEKVGFAGPPKPPKKIRWDTGTRPGRKSQSKRKYHVKRPEPCPGHYSWLSLREAARVQFRNKPGFKSWSRKGVPDGMSRPEAEKRWAEAFRRAEQEIEILWKKISQK